MFHVNALEGCGYSRGAVELLESKDIEFTCDKVTRDVKDNYKKKYNHPTFPQVFIEYLSSNNPRRILLGGLNELERYIDVYENMQHLEPKILKGMLRQIKKNKK